MVWLENLNSTPQPRPKFQNTLDNITNTIYHNSMNYDLFKKILRRIGTGMKIRAACEVLDSDQDIFYDFLYSDPKYEDLFRQALARRTDFIVDQIGELLEVHPDVDRLKLIRDYWLQVIKSQNSTTYGERKSVDLNIGMHERQLKEVLAIEMAKETTLDQLQDMQDTPLTELTL